MPQEEFTQKEKKILSRFCTNVDDDVFALMNLPDVIKGTLFSRYSRSPKGLKRLLLDEFINSSEIDLEAMVGNAEGASQLLAIGKAEKFYERVLVQYGDDSVAELGGAHLALENVSNLATKFIEDRRIGISPLEKSTRYVYFNEKANGEYRYYRDGLIMGSKFADDYIGACDLLFGTYVRLMGPTEKYFIDKFPREDGVGERAYEATIRAKVCDTLRGLLPASTLTNVGLFGNGRAFEYLIMRMRASPLGEMQSLAKRSYDELGKVFPVFMKRAYSSYGDASVEYYRSQKFPELAGQDVGAGASPRKAACSAYEGKCETPAGAVLADYDRDGVEKVIASILYSGSHLPMGECIKTARQMGAEERAKVISDYVGKRGNRRHRPGRAFENTYYLFDVCANFGAYRDLHRHRILTQERQLLTTANGYDVPQDLEDAGLARDFREAVENSAAVFQKLHAMSPEHAQYVVPFAYRIRWYIRMSLREAYHLIELRTVRQGHPDYRAIAQQMYGEMRRVHPGLVDGMGFVDMEKYGLERIDAERRADRKLSQIG